MSHVKTDIGQFAIVPLWLIEEVFTKHAEDKRPKGGSVDIQLFALLWAKYGNSPTKAEADGAHPSLMRLAGDLGVSVLTVIRSLERLEKYGALTVTRRKHPDSRENDTNEYTMHAVRKERTRNATEVGTCTSDRTVGRTKRTRNKSGTANETNAEHGKTGLFHP